MTDSTPNDGSASRAAGTAVDDANRDPAGASADGSLPNDSATTGKLPTVGAPDDPYVDPYVDRNSRAARGSGAAPTVGPSRPVVPPPPPRRANLPSAVDQYAALGLGGGAGSTSADATSADTLSADTRSADARSTAPTVAAAGSAGSAATAVPLAPGAGSPAAGGASSPVAVRRPRNERTPRRARLQLRHFNVWTVFKFSVVLAVALFFVWMIIVAVLYGTLDHLKVIDKINKTVHTIENNTADTKDAVTPRIVFTAAFLIGLVDIVLFIVLTTIGSVVYNLCADLVGGIEVTLAERD